MNEATQAEPRARRWRRPLMLGGVLLVAAVVLYLWLSGGRYVSTDDAYLRAAQTSISADIAGRVVAVEVRDNQAVHRGDVLFRLDQEPLQIAIAQAQAQLAAARLEVAALKAAYRARKSELAAARGTLDFQDSQYRRQKKLLEPGISSQTQVDELRHMRNTARAQIAADEQELARALAGLGGDPDIDPQQHPKVRQAQAELDRAELDLRHATVLAPEDGIVALVDKLQVGDYLPAATPAFVLVSTHKVWVETNFKEVQLAHVRAGQPATVELDIQGDREFRAHVAGVSPGTGSQFSVLPAENATGNWVKVMQRLPVRIEFEKPDDLPPVRTGLSATVTVDTGYRRHLFGHDSQDGAAAQSP